jgi:hypothetical protein
MIMHRVHQVVLAILAILAPLLLIACDTPPPGVTNVAGWREALQECRQIARVAYGYGNSGDFDAIGQPRHFIHNTSWEMVDPCMVARGFPPPP